MTEQASPTTSSSTTSTTVSSSPTQPAAPQSSAVSKPPSGTPSIASVPPQTVQTQSPKPSYNPTTPVLPPKQTGSISAAQAAVQPQAPVAKPVAAPIFTIKPMGANREDKYLKALIYAKFGVGKTTFAGSAVDVERMRDVLVISAEGGELTMFDNPRIKNVGLIDVIQVRSFTQLSSVRDFLFAHTKFRDAGDDANLRLLQQRVFAGTEAAEPDARLRKFRTVVIDSLTEINEYCLSQILGMHSGMSLNSDLPTAEFKEYKQNYTKMQMFIRMYRDLALHVVMTAAAGYEKDELNKFHWTPSMTGKLSAQIQGVFDVIGFMVAAAATESAPSPRRLFVQPVGGTFDSKCRLAGCKKSFFDDPVMDTFTRESGFFK